MRRARLLVDVTVQATDKPPARVDVYDDDVPVGYRMTVEFSGALPAWRVDELPDRVEKLRQRRARRGRYGAGGARRRAAGRLVGDSRGAAPPWLGR
ncbi:hypothetical protein EST54_14575 [Streptomyces sioyaensis]|uniref:Uncharacterized protein n=1 Tax=Streptomyces sioyaensis TaxID=67364 RepID=A0A4Q1R1N4_9ACTN|nr:hypothetical protein EST54_14575 [Streptomyces sioyaensis]